MTAQLIPDRPAPARPRRPKRTYAASFMYDTPGRAAAATSSSAP